MSIELMTAVWRTDIGPAAKRLVLLALADSANDDGVCWPSMAHVARKAACGLSTARDAIAELEKAGYLAREERRINGERNQSNIYRLDVARIRREGAAEIQREVPPESGGSAAEIRRENPKKIPKEEPKDLAAGAASADGVASKPVVYSPEFEAAWIAYNRKGAKRKAWLEWQRAIKRAPVEIITGAIPPYLASVSDRKYAKDFERYLSGDVWEAHRVDAPAVQAMDVVAADNWLFERFQAGDAEGVAARTGREYHAPTAAMTPNGQTPEEYRLADARHWIKTNRPGLRRVLTGQTFKNGTEVQS